MAQTLIGIVSSASLLQITPRLRVESGRRLDNGSESRLHATPGRSSMTNNPKSFKGQLLLDGGSLKGSFFHRAVVLICQHDEEGAFGLVLNRAAGSTVGELLVADLPDSLKEQRLFLGGPVQPSVLSFLHTDLFLPTANVMPNLVLGHSLENLVEIGESFSSTNKVKIFAGYSGWSAGQLEDEMERQAWVTHPADLDLIFSSDPVELWRKIMQQKGAKYRLLAEAPEDLSWN